MQSKVHRGRLGEMRDAIMVVALGQLFGPLHLESRQGVLPVI